MSTSARQHFAFLNDVNNVCLYQALVNEHSQTIAVIVACLPQEKAAYIIESLTPERQLAVIRRIAVLQQVEEAVLTVLEDALKFQVNNQKFVALGGLKKVAHILSGVNQTSRGYILENLAQDDPAFVDSLNLEDTKTKHNRNEQ
jgi:flagellar motor switch protein FliG